MARSSPIRKKTFNFNKIFLLLLLFTFSFLYATDDYFYEKSNILVDSIWAFGKFSYGLTLNIFTFVVMAFIISNCFTLSTTSEQTDNTNNSIGSLLKCLKNRNTNIGGDMNNILESSALKSTLRDLLDERRAIERRNEERRSVEERKNIGNEERRNVEDEERRSVEVESDMA